MTRFKCVLALALIAVAALTIGGCRTTTVVEHVDQHDPHRDHPDHPDHPDDHPKPPPPDRHDDRR